MSEAFRRYLPPRRLLGLAASFIGVAFAAVAYSRRWPPGFDARCYWSFDPARPYAGHETQLGNFPYSPAAGQLFALTHALPENVFVALWLGLSVALLVWLGRGWGLACLLFPPVLAEVFAGNVHMLYAALIVVGFRYPAVWAFVLLTKITPGVGLLWFAVRREWRPLAIALGTTAAIAAVSFALAPGLWFDWAGYLRSESGLSPSWPSAIPIPLVPRLLVAVLVVAWGARRDARWTVPIAVTLALPVLWLSGLAVLMALPRTVAANPLARVRRRREDGGKLVGAERFERSTS